ncbi:MAG: AAA family ATPase [Ktedonobacteraceae bacterium]
MFQISIANFGGCSKADINVDTIALLVGANAAGKSSICDAVAWALTGKEYGLQKNEAGQVVRSGSDSATIEIKTADGSIRGSFPDCKFKPEGKQPTASEYATGLKSILTLKDDDKASALQTYLKTLPTQEDLATRLAALRIDKSTIESVWMRIVGGSWDKAQNYFEEVGRQLKAQWKVATGHPGNYGSDIAGKWLPKNWEQDLEKLSIDTLATELTREKEMLESSLKYEAVSDKERSELDEVYLGLDQAQKDHAEHIKMLADKKKALAEAEYALTRLPPDKEQKTVPCPHCSAKLVVVGDTVEKPRTKILSAEDAAKMNEAIRDAHAKLTECQRDVEFERRLVDDSIRRQDAAKKAEARLKEIAAQPTCPPAEQVEKQRKAVERAERRLDAATRKRSADSINEQIIKNQFLIDVLKPEGLRADKLANALKSFNEDYLKPLCEAARMSDPAWGDAEVTNDLKIVFANRAKRLSESEKFRLRVTLQIAFAQLDGSQMLVIDRADLLDPEGRSGLVCLLQQAGIPALVAMTATRKHDVIDLGAHGLGITYSIKGSVVEELKAPVAA